MWPETWRTNNTTVGERWRGSARVSVEPTKWGRLEGHGLSRRSRRPPACTRLYALREKVPLPGIARQVERGREVSAGGAALPAAQLQLAERRRAERVVGHAVA